MYLKNILKLIQRQIDKGLNKNGTNLEDSKLFSRDLIVHAQEEVIDLLFYLEAIKKEGKKEKDISDMDSKIDLINAEIKNIRNKMILEKNNNIEISKTDEHVLDYFMKLKTSYEFKKKASNEANLL